MINNLPQVNFAEKSTSEIQTAVITTYETISGRKLYPGDPIRLFLEAVSLIIVQQRVLIDFSAKQNLLAYASGDFLAHLGVLVGIYRLPTAKAQTSLKFILSAAQNSVVTIPAGTRATIDGRMSFATKFAAQIPAGVTSIELAAECSQEGTVGNGFIPGQINIIVDPLPCLKSVVNVTTTQGGADIETDEAYRERIRIAPEAYSSAGPEGAYMAQVKKASALIQDVSVRSPDPGEVEVCVLLKNGELPGRDILELIAAACNSKSVRPLTDHVSVIAPTIVNYDIELVYYIATAEQANVLSIQQSVNNAVEEFVLWQKSKLGRDINPSNLTAKIMRAGAKRIILNKPDYVSLIQNNIAIAENIKLVFGGVEDE